MKTSLPDVSSQTDIPPKTDVSRHGLPSRTLAVRILKGKTAHPLRPINCARFLIGAGSNCQLKLGGEMPMVHSVITWNGSGPFIECLVPDPPLIVEGEERREAELTVGTLMEIGPFRFEIAVIDPVAESATESRKSPGSTSIAETTSPHAAQIAATAEPVPAADILAPDPEDQSIHELVDRLGDALERLEQIEWQRRQGLAALLEAVARTAPPAPPSAVPAASEPSELLQRRSA